MKDFRHIFLFLIFIGTSSWAICSDSLFTIVQIDVQGNKRTRAEIVLREMTIQVGDTLSASRYAEVLERNRQNIYNLRLFTVIKIDSTQQGNSIKLIVSVKERWYMFVSPYFVNEERNFYDFSRKIKTNISRPPKNWEPMRLSYGAFLFWRNFTGRNESLYLSGQLGFSRRIEAEYTLPWLFPTQKIDFYTVFNYIERKQIISDIRQDTAKWATADQSPLTTTYDVKLILRKRFDLFRSLSVKLGYLNVIGNDSLPLFNPTYLTHSRLREHYPSLFVIYNHDKRDIRSFPLDGIRYRLYGRVSGIIPSSTTSFAKVGFSFAQFIPLSKRWNFAWGAQHVQTIGRRIPFFESNFLWIDRDEFPDINYEIRGYQRFSADGQGISILKGELKYAIFPRKMVHLGWIPFKKFQDFPFGFYLSGFSDSGYIQEYLRRNRNNTLQNRLLYGYGAGANIIFIYDALFRIEYIWNHTADIRQPQFLRKGGVNFQATIPIR